MREIFIKGSFDGFKNIDLKMARSSINESLIGRKIPVFISHKHEDLDDLKGIIGFLGVCFNVKAYIDSRDPSMPKITSGETAKIIKNRIKNCKKFILLATDAAIESKWCNWELGFGDAAKLKENVVLFPMKKRGIEYKGNEYMEIYSYISYYEEGDKYSSGKNIVPGYYVTTRTETGKDIIPLREWLEK